MQYMTAFLSGAVFALGLALSGMIKPSKVVGFLDFAGDWDPSLAFVMGGALLVFGPGYRWVRSRARPVVAERFDLPTQKEVTPELAIGAAIFGVGWGVSGMCPAAAIAGVPAFTQSALGVTFGMAVGIVGMRAARNALARKATTAELGPAADF